MNGADSDQPVELHEDVTLEVSENVLASTVEDELVMLDQDEEVYYGLNHVGAFLWDQLSAPQRVSDLEQATAERFEVTADQCREDVREFLENLLEADLVRRT